MSRETDSSSPGTQGRGGAAYPSGTPPYGTPAPGPADGGTAGARKGPRSSGADEPRTETTLTTRIRINIPGSRPIPPVVLRKPMGDGGEGSGPDGADASDASDGASGPAGSASYPQAPVAESAQAAVRTGTATGSGGSGGGSGAAGKPAASDWFSPRRPPSAAAPSAARVPASPAPPGPPEFAAPPAPDGLLPPIPPVPGAPQQPNLPYTHDTLAMPRPSAAEPSPTPTGPTTGPATGEARLGYRPPGRGSGTTSPFGSQPQPGQPGQPGSQPSSPFGSPFDADGRKMFGMAGTPDLPNASPPADGDTRVSTAPGPGPQAPAPEPVEPTAPTGSQRPKRRGGRSWLTLAGVGLVSAIAVAYGAGLLMDHADVPNGVVVLGTDIGGSTRGDAMKALNAAVGGPATAPLVLRIGDQTRQLDPKVAGLGIDTEQTVREVAHRDYNPITVIGSLFGQSQRVTPAITVDQEKLSSALATIAAGTGSGSDGMVKFVDGRPVGVPGRPYQAIDHGSAMQAIVQAFTTRAETGQNEPVQLQVTTHQPKVTQAAIDAAIRTIGDPAMSGRITVVAGSVQVPFSPQRSLSKILTILPDPEGQLTLHFDLNKMKQLYGNAFNGILLQRGDGSKTPVTPQDVASAMMPELRTTGANKIATIPNVAH